MMRKILVTGLIGLAVAVGGSPATAEVVDSRPLRSTDALVTLDLPGLSGLLLDVPGDVVTWTKEPASPLLQMTNMVPGQSVAVVVGVHNDTDEPASLSLKALDVRDDDGECVEPESAAGDASCGSGVGELGPELRFVITRDPERDGSFESEPVFSGTLQELTAGTPLGDEALPAFSAWDFRFELAVAREAGNVIMGDLVSFDLAWTSTTPGGATETIEVPGTVAGIPSKPSLLKPVTDALGILVALPVTGAGLGLLGGALSLVAFGLMLRLGARRRKGASDAPVG